MSEHDSVNSKAAEVVRERITATETALVERKKILTRLESELSEETEASAANEIQKRIDAVYAQSNALSALLTNHKATLKTLEKV